jgi:hypothetical protein
MNNYRWLFVLVFNIIILCGMSVLFYITRSPWSFLLLFGLMRYSEDDKKDKKEDA